MNSSSESHRSFKINKVSFLNGDEFDLDYEIYKLSLQADKIIAKYVNDTHSSIWISKEANYQQFPQKYQIQSGGWYGPENGGRWRTLKRYFGTLNFTGVRDLVQRFTSEESQFKICKPLFKTRFVVNSSNEKIGALTFRCQDIVVNPSNRVFLLNLHTRTFEDMTELLTENDMRLIE